MPVDVYGRGAQDFGGAFAADAAKIVFSAADVNDGGVGLLTQNLNVAYQQQISRIYEIGTQKTFYVIGRAQGQAGLGRVLGPRPVTLGFYQKFGNGCNAAENNIDLLADTGCTSTGGQITNFTNGVYAFTMKNVVITNFGLTVNANDMLINEQLQMMFVALNVGQGAG